MKKIGRYEIVEELGRGAMGVVYKAFDPTIGRHVAIKVLSLEAPVEVGVPAARDIFMREARAAGRLSHPGIVTIHDALEDPESRSSYIVMEFIPGRTLESVLLQKQALGTEEALEIIRQVADALDYAHRQQIIHRDLKPANILLAADGRVKLTDFGIAKIISREGALRTMAIMGTPAYMSPEQVSGREVDARSDLFSLGILLYLVLTGEKPFGGDTAAVMFKIVYEDPLLPTQINPQLSPGHDYLVLRCLAKDRTKRYGSARDFLDDLEDVCQGRPPRSEVRFPRAELRAERTMVARKPLLTLPEARPIIRKGWKWVTAGIAAGALVVLLVGLGAWRLRQRGVPPPAVSAEPGPPSVQPSVSKPVKPEELTRAAEKEVAGPATAPTGTTSSTPATATGAPPRAAAPAGPRPAPARAPTVSTTRAEERVATLICRHELERATLTVSSGSAVILRADLQGKKKRSFVGKKASYSGFFSDSFRIPATARELTVRVYSEDGSINLLNKISALPPAGASDGLLVLPSRAQLALKWMEPVPAKR